MSNKILTTIDLIRHGEPQGGRRYRGQIDDPLSDKGWRQMREAVGDHCPWHAILSSPLQRCAAFARELAARHGVPLREDARWMEIGFGTWEGRTPAELEAESPGILQRFWNEPIRHAPPGAEPLAAFHDRIVAAWEELLGEYRGSHVLVVGHAGVVRMVVRHVLDMPLERLFRIQVGNAAITRIQVEHSGDLRLPRLVFLGGRL